MTEIMSRSEVQKHLETILGKENVYFNRPENIKLKYPCFVYSRNGYSKRNANNHPYQSENRFQVLYIYDSIKDAPLVEKLKETKGFEYDREYDADGLYHASFTFHIY